MRTWLVCIGAFLASAAGAQPSVPNESIPSIDSAAARFIAAARAGTARYRDRSVAIADGYHLVGPDLPSMGEHWLNIALILADSVDAAHPPVLIYVASPQGPVLAGAAYTRLLASNQHFPDFPHGLHAWHDHSGFIEDEALPMSHGQHGAQASHESPNGTRLGILHLWMWEENPLGAWTADNWALPFVRAGVRPPRPAEAAAHSLALAADSGRYYLGVLATVGKLEPVEVDSLRVVLANTASEVRSTPLTPTLSPREIEQLEASWRQLWPLISGALRTDSLRRLEDLRALWW